MKKLILATIFILSLSCAVAGAAKEAPPESPVTHTVVRGDTLWDLSEFYLKNPLLWPSIWQINPKIADPHWIFPGQVFRIPPLLAPIPTQAVLPDLPGRDEIPALGQALAIRLKERAEIQVIEEVEKDRAAFTPQVDRGIGMVTWEIPGQGKVLATEQGWLHAATGAILLVDAPGARLGEKFGVYRDLGKIQPLSLQETSPGHLVADIAIIEIITTGPTRQRAVVRRAFTALKANDLLGPVQQAPQAPIVTTVTPKLDGLVVKGAVIAIQDLRSIAGSGTIVYIDRGKDHGLTPGLLLSVKQREGDGLTKIHQAGELLVLRVTADRAAALVTDKSNYVVRTGDLVDLVQ